MILIYTFFDRKESAKETLGTELHSLNNCTVRPETIKLAGIICKKFYV